MMMHVDGILFENPANGKIATKLLRSDYNLDTIPHFTDSDIVSVSDLRKTAWDSTINRSRLTFKNRASGYDDAVAMSDDFALIQYQGRVRSADRSMSSVTSPVTASWIAARNLSYSNVPLMTLTLDVNRRGASILPGDVIKVTHTKGFVLNGLVMRIVKVELGSLDSGVVRLRCIQDRFSSHIGSYAAPGASQFTPPDTAARAITSFQLVTAPFMLGYTGGDPAAFESVARMLVLAKAPGPGSQSFDVPYSTTTTVSADAELIGDDLPYSVIGTVGSTYLAATAAGNRLDTTQSLVVGGLTSAQMAQIENLSSIAEARSGLALMMIGTELFVYLQPIFDLGAGTVRFTQLYRGVLDTAPDTHNAGAAVYFIEGSSAVTEGVPAGSTAYVKLLDETATANFPIGSAAVASLAVSDRASRPLPQGNVTLNGSRTPAPVSAATSIPVAWARRSRLNTSLVMYNEADNALEPGTNARVRWRVGGGSFTTVLSTANTINLAVTGMTGTLEVIVDGWDPRTSKASLVSETITMTLNP